uniref:Uncharacterized protein n=1 Tax=Knipowitschia caucasica TaxID=637954 RepID=A0AAV2KFX5_KNICA
MRSCSLISRSAEVCDGDCVRCTRRSSPFTRAGPSPVTMATALKPREDKDGSRPSPSSPVYWTGIVV